MKRRLGRISYATVLLGLLISGCASAQSNSYERSFPQSKRAIENALKAMQGNMAGKLPSLEGFAKPGEHPLDRYRRGYFQASAEVLPGGGGGSIVRIRAKVTAWYSDASAAQSGYQLLMSNGRLESDLLDQLSEELASTPSEKTAGAASEAKSSPEAVPDEHPAAPEPVRKFPDTSSSLAATVRPDMSPGPEVEKNSNALAKPDNALKAEVESLEQILKNTAHPHNLVAVKKSGTPVVSTPSLTAKPQFLASQHDEFELLDFNADWVHVRISGLSRGWIWRNSVEMPEGIPDTTASSGPASAPVADMFHVVREDTAPFPGDWEPLRGKNVRILSVQKLDEAAKSAGAKERLEYTKFLLEKSYTEIVEKKSEVAGIVVIFDAADGGMIGATVPVLQQWKAGTLTDAALWHKCFFDPPEVFDSSNNPGGQ